MQDARSDEARLLAAARPPTIALWLGWLGVLPFAALAGAAPFLASWAKHLALHALVAYGAIILSFLGGVHWGLAIGAGEGLDRGRRRTQLIVSVVPSLVGWMALLFIGKVAFLVLAAAVAVMLLADLRAGAAGLTPRWYARLRWPLSCAVIVAFALAALSAG